MAPTRSIIHSEHSPFFTSLREDENISRGDGTHSKLRLRLWDPVWICRHFVTQPRIKGRGRSNWEQTISEGRQRGLSFSGGRIVLDIIPALKSKPNDVTPIDGNEATLVAGTSPLQKPA